MAGVSRSSSCYLLLLISLLFSFSCSEGREIPVGGKTGVWAVPSSQQPQSLTQWADAYRFIVGDTLVWKYDADQDSVLEVTKEGFESCNTTSPIAEHKEDETKLTLTRPGPYYFISGAQGHCQKGQKVELVVISPRRHHHSHSLAPAPSPSDLGTTAVPPSSGASGITGGFKGLVLASSLLVFGFLF